MITATLKVNPENPEIDKIKFAAAILIEGGIVAFPTETVYGLGANARNKDAVGRIYEIKKRPQGKPLTIHIAELEKLKEITGEISPLAQQLIKRFWPGPLTLILNSKEGEKVGIRMPKGTIPSLLIKESGVLVVAPSANLSGKEPAGDAARVKESFDGLIELIVDGGKCEMGVASTVVDLTSSLPKVIRGGAISKEELGIG